MSSKKKTTSNQTTAGTTNVVQTPTNPAFVTQGLGDIGASVAKLNQMDPYSFVAAANPSLTQAAAGAGALTTSPNFGQAAGIYSNVAGQGANTAQGASLLDGLQNYMSPYTNDVVDTTLAGYDQNAGRQQAQDRLGLAGDATFGGSGGSILQALDNQNLALGRAQTEAQLRNSGFNTGAQLSAQDAAQRQQAAQFNATAADLAAQRQLAAAGGLASTGAAAGADARANVDTQGGLGQVLQNIDQARAGAPINSLGSISSIMDGLPLGLLHGTNSNGVSNSTSNGTTTETSSDPLKAIGSLAAAAGALGFSPFTGGASLAGMGAIVSDRRTKTDIEKVGELDNGLAVFKYRYKTGGPMQIGVMAQDVLKKQPGAVSNIGGGLLGVDYGQLVA